MDTTAPKVPLTKIPVYEVRLVQSRRPLRLAESIMPHAGVAGFPLRARLAAAVLPFPPAPPKIPYGEFSPVRLEGQLVRRDLPARNSG
jgi:hypothetical protein